MFGVVGWRIPRIAIASPAVTAGAEKMHEYSLVAVDSLREYPQNARTHDERQVQQIADSISEFGFTNPLLVDGEGGLVAGHGRLMAAKLLGITEVPAITLKGLTDVQRRAYVIADNKLALNAGWDYDILQQELRGLEALDFDIELTGFSMDEFQLSGVDYGVLDGENVDDELDAMASNVKKAIQIEFEGDDYEEALALVKKYRDAGAYIGGILMTTLAANEREL